MTLNIGSKLQNGRYEIMRYISSGGFGNLYEGFDSATNKRVAIKEFFIASMCSRNTNTRAVVISDKSKADVVKRVRHKFIEEGQTLLIMKHPNIVKAYDVFDENGTSYYTMEYYSSGSLSDRLKDGILMSEEHALAYMREICGALQYIHSHNRLHLDVKPSNIMITPTGHAVLIDFGVSKHYSEQTNQNDTTLLGKSVGYAPIEQLENNVQTFSPSTDIYALGATLYKLVTGKTPPSAVSILTEGINLQIYKLSFRVVNIISTCMRVKKDDRPQSIEEVINMIDKSTDETIIEKPIEEIDPQNLSIEECDAFGMSQWAKGNFEKAITFFESGWSRGGLNSLFYLALCYEQKGDYLSSTKLLKIASDKGQIDAQCQLALCFEEGLGVPQNHRAAVKLCELAAKRGSLYGQEKLKGLDRSFGSLANYKAMRWAIFWLVLTIVIIVLFVYTITGDSRVNYAKLMKAAPAPLFTASYAYYKWQEYLKSLKY